AAANYVPLVAANRIGVEPGGAGELRFYGSSFIAGPTGEIVAELGRDEEGLIQARFDLAVIARARASWGLFRDRRPVLYGPLLSAVGREDRAPGNTASGQRGCPGRYATPMSRAGMRRSTGKRSRSLTTNGGLGSRWSASTRVMTRFWIAVCMACVSRVGSS